MVVGKGMKLKLIGNNSTINFIPKKKSADILW